VQDRRQILDCDGHLPRWPFCRQAVETRKMSAVSDSELIKRLGSQGTRLLKRLRAIRVWSSLGFVFSPLLLFAVLGLFG
jgi:hypothetical protein